MSVLLNADTTNGLVLTSDLTGNVEIQNDGTTKLTVNSSGATVAGTLAATAVTGDGSALTGISTGGMTLLDTLTTTSGTEHVTATLDLSTYKFLFLSLYNVGTSSAPTLDLQWKETGGTYVKILNYTVVGASIYGSVNHDLGNGVSNVFDSSNIPDDSTIVAPEGGAFPGVNTAIDTATTSITFRWSADDTFDKGVITIYGVK
jgi:hypothetical protein